MLRGKEDTAAVVSVGTGLGGHKAQPFDFCLRGKLRSWWERMGLVADGVGHTWELPTEYFFQGALPELGVLENLEVQESQRRQPGEDPKWCFWALWSWEMSCRCCLRGQGEGNIMKDPLAPSQVAHSLWIFTLSLARPPCPPALHPWPEQGLASFCPVLSSAPCAPGGGGGLRPLCQAHLGQSSCGPDPHPATWFPAVERATYSPLRVELGPTPGSPLRQS